ncbi:MAG TPA: protein rep [Lacipirellulaceae bacterium]|nr:protein rep [Lacipirellulaceae bacterium]
MLDVRPITQAEERWRHGGWAARRHRPYAALYRLNTRPQTLHAYANCGSAARVQWSEARESYRVVSNRCRCRWCAPCAAARGRIVAQRLRTLFDGQPITMMTLTLRHNDTTLAAQLLRLRRAFANLRRDKWFASQVKGGVAVVEVKLGRDQRWHVHHHVLMQAEYLDKKQLAAKWLAITGDSSIVDLRRVDPGKGSSYVTKYVAKPADNAITTQPDKFDEMICAMKGARLFNAFGTMKKIAAETPTDAEEEFLPDDWIDLGSLDECRRDPIIMQKLAASRNHEPEWSDST